MTATIERNFLIVAAALSTAVAIFGVRNFGEYYWINLTLAAVTVAAAAATWRWLWMNLKPDHRSPASFSVLTFGFWLVVWYWYVDDFYADYWMIVLVNASSCAILCTIFCVVNTRWPSLRPQVICFALGLLASCIAFWNLQVRLFADAHGNARVEFLAAYFGLPIWTLAFGTAFLLVWLLLLHPLVKWRAQAQRVVAATRPASANGAAPLRRGRGRDKPPLSPLRFDQRVELWKCVDPDGSKRIIDSRWYFSVGARLPPSIGIFALPADAERVVPQYRGLNYVIARDELLIVDPRDREVLAVVSA